MAITNTKLSHTFWGDKKVVFGKSVISGATATGDVALSTMGLKIVDMFFGIVKSATASGVNANEDFPCSADITVITHNNDETFYWVAIGIPS